MISPSQTHLQIATNWLASFNSRNLEALLALYHADAAHYSPKLKIREPHTHGLIKGRAALRAWWQEAFDRLPDLQYDCTSLTADDQRVFMEYTRRVSGEPDMLVAEVLDIEHGLIVASRVYHG